MGTVIKCRLSADSLRKAAKEVEKYRKSLNDKCRIFRQRLIEAGIDAARETGGEYIGAIVFTTEDQGENVSCLVAKDGTKIVRRWRYKGGYKEAEVSPLLMAEFGSGWLSENLFDVGGVGQGTFPEQKHAFDEAGWHWTTEDNITHHSRGEAPTHPMNQAIIAMMQKVDEIGKEVFGTNEVIKC